MSKYRLLAALIFISSVTAHAAPPAELKGNASLDDSIESELEPEQDPIAEESKSSIKSDFTPIPQNEKPPSGSGEKIFDWSKHQNDKEVAHPFAEKGLIRITKDRTYIYKVDESDQKRAASFRFGIFKPDNLSNPDAAGQAGSTFDDNYDQTNTPALMFDYEWQLWQSAVGKFGIRAGTGAYIAQGNGHFNGTTNAGLTPHEIFTFWAMPNTLGVVYRAQFWDKQLFIPYAEGGGIAFAFGEFRDDDKPPKWGGALAGYGAGGLAINLTYFDNMARIQLDREYGINRVYLTLEMRIIVAFSDRYDFSTNMANAGFLMEY